MCTSGGQERLEGRLEGTTPGGVEQGHDHVGEVGRGTPARPATAAGPRSIRAARSAMAEVMSVIMADDRARWRTAAGRSPVAGLQQLQDAAQVGGPRARRARHAGNALGELGDDAQEVAARTGRPAAWRTARSRPATRSRVGASSPSSSSRRPRSSSSAVVVALEDRAQQPLPRAEVVGQRRVVALAGGVDDLLGPSPGTRPARRTGARPRGPARSRVSRGVAGHRRLLALTERARVGRQHLDA